MTGIEEKSLHHYQEGIFLEYPIGVDFQKENMRPTSKLISSVGQTVPGADHWPPSLLSYFSPTVWQLCSQTVRIQSHQYDILSSNNQA